MNEQFTLYNDLTIAAVFVSIDLFILAFILGYQLSCNIIPPPPLLNSWFLFQFMGLLLFLLNQENIFVPCCSFFF